MGTHEHHPISSKHIHLCSVIVNITHQRDNDRNLQVIYSTQCMCKSHPEFQGELWVQNFATYTRINMLCKSRMKPGKELSVGQA